MLYYYIVGFEKNTFSPQGHFRVGILLFYESFWKITLRYCFKTPQTFFIYFSSKA